MSDEGNFKDNLKQSKNFLSSQSNSSEIISNGPVTESSYLP